MRASSIYRRRAWGKRCPTLPSGNQHGVLALDPPPPLSLCSYCLWLLDFLATTRPVVDVVACTVPYTLYIACQLSCLQTATVSRLRHNRKDCASPPHAIAFLGAFPFVCSFVTTDFTLVYLTRHYVMRHGACTTCLLYTSPSPRDATLSRMPSSA